MSRIKEWWMGMEEDAVSMSLDEWLDKHGTSNQEVYENINGPMQDISAYEED